jgi:hypothetical protein
MRACSAEGASSVPAAPGHPVAGSVDPALSQGQKRQPWPSVPMAGSPGFPWGVGEVSGADEGEGAVGDGERGGAEGGGEGVDAVDAGHRGLRDRGVEGFGPHDGVVELARGGEADEHDAVDGEAAEGEAEAVGVELDPVFGAGSSSGVDVGAELLVRGGTDDFPVDAGGGDAVVEVGGSFEVGAGAGPGVDALFDEEAGGAVGVAEGLVVFGEGFLEPGVDGWCRRWAARGWAGSWLAGSG